MTPHDWYVENRVAFVARALEASEERLFSDHLPRCEECRREVARLERDLGALPMAATPIAKTSNAPLFLWFDHSFARSYCTSDPYSVLHARWDIAETQSYRGDAGQLHPWRS